MQSGYSGWEVCVVICVEKENFKSGTCAFETGTESVSGGLRSSRLSFPGSVFVSKVHVNQIKRGPDNYERKDKVQRKCRDGGEKRMATGSVKSGRTVTRRSAPALDPESRENQMISLAVDQAETMLLEGRAPTQIVVHYLKLATTKNQLEKEKLRKENILLEAKANAIEAAAKSEELYARAIEAMREYSGSLTHNYEVD